MDPETDVLIENEVATKAENELIVHNDNVNSFQSVQEALMDILGHTLEQAVQCSYLVHFKGKCSVKRGSFKKLQPLCYALLDRKLSATIE